MTTPTKTRMPLAEAEAVAAELTALLAPTCRGSRIMRRDVPFRPSYTGCPDCTDWLDHRTHAWDDHNGPVFRRDPAREVAAIRRALSAMRRAAVPS